MDAVGGRNAQFFANKKNIKYYSFDPSNTSLKYFNNLNLDKENFYVSNSIDDTIKEQKYDLIFSCYVLQHVGFLDKKENEQFDTKAIMNEIIPLLNERGYMFFFELHKRTK